MAIDLTTYYLHRSKMKTGDALIFKGKGVLSRLIQLGSLSEYSHVAMLLWVKFYQENRLMIAHAAFPKGVVLVHASRYLQLYKGDAEWLQANHQAVADKVDADYKGKLADFMAMQSGRTYNTKGVVSYVLPIFNDEASAYYCSQLVAAAWKHVGAITSDRLRPDELVSSYIYPRKVSLD